MASDERDLPSSFDPQTGQNVKWSARLGTETHATPIVAGGRVYIGTNNGEPRDPKHQGDRGVLMCFEEKSGRLSLAVGRAQTRRGHLLRLAPERDMLARLPSKASASISSATGAKCSAWSGWPTTPSARASYWLFDLPTGAGIWSHDAAHSSILIRGNLLYLNTGTGVDNTHKRIRAPDAPSLVVLDKRTGRLVARDNEHIAPNIFHSTWSAPSSGEVNGRPLIFFAAGNGIVYAFDPIPDPPSPQDSSAAARRPAAPIPEEGIPIRL